MSKHSAWAGKPAMNRRLILFVSPVAVAFAVAGSETAAAQDAPSATTGASNTDQSLAVQEIIVSARRYSETLQSTPVAVTALSAEDLQARSLSDISGVAKVAPNMTFLAGSSTGSSSNAQVFIRGVGQDDFLPTADPGVGIYVDDVYLGRTVGGLLKTNDLAQIEVLRGPQGTLFGRNTIGGAISIHTVKPSHDETTGFVATQVGTDNLLEASGAVGGPISSTLAARVSFLAHRRDGFGKSSASDIDFGNERYGLVRAAVDWRPSDSFHYTVSADYYHQRQNNYYAVNFGAGCADGVVRTSCGNSYRSFGDIYSYNFLNGATPFTEADIGSLANPYQSSATGPSQDDVDSWGVSGNGELVLNDWATVRSITAYRKLSSDFASDNDATRARLGDTYDRFRQDQFSQELQLGFDTEKLKGAFGIYYFTENGRDQTLVYTATSGSFQTDGRLKLENWAGYGQATFAITPALRLTAGGRITYEKKTYNFSQALGSERALSALFPFLLPTVISPVRLVRDWTNFAPKLGIDYTTGGGTLLYGSYSQGFKSGTFNGRATQSAAVTEVKPERVDQYEVGFKTTLFDKRVRFNTAAFYSNYKDIQLQAVSFSNGLLISLINAGKARIYGIETELTANVTRSLTINASGGYANSKVEGISATDAATTGVQNGNVLKKTPKWTAAIGGEYRVPAGADELRMRLDYNWRSSQFHNAANSPLAKEGAYGVLDGRISYAFGTSGLELAIFGRNLTDKVFYNNIFVSNTTATANPTRGREVGASLRFNF